MKKLLPYRYRVVLLLFFLILITLLDRTCISLVGVRIKTAFHLSNEQFGWVLGAFALAYALFEIPSGHFGDRIGQRAVLIPQMNQVFLLICAFILFNNTNGIAQPPKKEITHYEKALSTSKKDDTNQVKVYLEYARSLSGDSVKWSFRVADKARTLSEKLNYPHGVAMALYQLGACLEIEKNYSSAIRYYDEGAKIAEQHHLYEDIAIIYGANLNMNYYLADYTNAMHTAQKGLEIADKQNDIEQKAHYDSQIGYIYLKQENPDQAIRYFEKYLKFATLVNNRMMIADANDGLAEGYLLKADYKTSLACLNKSFDIYNEMGQTETIEKSRKISKDDRLVYTLFKLSRVYKLSGNYKEALFYSRQIFKRHIIEGKTYNTYDVAQYYINAGDIFTSLRRYGEAGRMLNKGMTLARLIRHRGDMMDAYDAISKNFARRRLYDSAYLYHLLFTGLKDSIINEKTAKEINKLELERKDKEITVLNQQRELKEAEFERQKLNINLIIGLTTFIAVITVMLLYIKSTIKHQKLILEKHHAIETERQRISSDMHDDIGTGLSTMLIYINMLKSKLAGTEEAAGIERISELGTELVGQMKEIVWSLSATNDGVDNLLLFIRQYFVMLFESLGYRININYPSYIPGIELKSDVRRNIFLCVKEASTNIIKHAQANAVELHVQIIAGELIIQIKDNGRGLVLPANTATKGNGLKNIAARMSTVHGRYKFFNCNGTVVLLALDLSAYPNG